MPGNVRPVSGHRRQRVPSRARLVSYARPPYLASLMSCLFVEHLTVIDCAYLDAARGLVGESWIVDVELEGELDDQSMVLDFGHVKKRLKSAIDTSVDHGLLVPMRSAALQMLEFGASSRLLFKAADGPIEHRAPSAAVCPVDAEVIDADAVTAYLRPLLQAVLPPNVERLGLHLRSEANDGPYYHYVHGLKKHDGLCQRIAHGHRSRIEVRVGGARQPALEQALATHWRDIYLGSREDIVAESSDRIRFAYTAREGKYELALPRHRVDLLDTDSTVEQIARHLATRLRHEGAEQPIEVRAYEGVRKGAIARL